MTSRRVALALCFLAAACASSYTPRTNTRADLERYVERAAALVRDQGASAACTTFSQPAWKAGDYYVFITDVDNNTLVCHPLRADLVGQNQDNLQDANGRYFGRDLRAAASSPSGRGWVEYVWARPGQTNVVPKSTYIMAVTGPDGRRYAVGSGGYEMPPR